MNFRQKTTKSLPIVFATFSIFLIVASASAQSSNLVGTWTFDDGNEALRLVFMANGSFTMAITEQGNTQNFSGNYQDYGNSFLLNTQGGQPVTVPYTMSGQQNMTITVSGMQYTLQRSGATQNNAGGGSLSGMFGAGGNNSNQTNATISATQANTAGWATYKHPMGLTFQHPSNWQAQENGSMIQLIPADQQTNQQGAVEAYLVFGEAAQGIQDPSSLQVVQYMDGQVAQAFPFLSRTGNAERFGKGAVISYAGNTPSAGQMTGKIYVTIANGYAIALFALAPTQTLTRREQTAAAIFNTFSFNTANAGSGKIDPALVGAWQQKKYGGDSEVSTEHTYITQLQPNGTYTVHSKSFMGGVTGMTDVDVSFSGGTDFTLDDKGRWSAENGKLTLISEKQGMGTVSYQLQGNTLIIIYPNGQREQHTRVQ